MSMDINHMQRSLHPYMLELYCEGFINNQFFELQELQDDSNPNFVVEVVSLFIEDSERILRELTGFLQEPCNVDFKRVHACVHQFKGSSSGIGAQRVRSACDSFSAFCERHNFQGCFGCLLHLKHEFYALKTRLQTLFEDFRWSGGFVDEDGDE